MGAEVKSSGSILPKMKTACAMASSAEGEYDRLRELKAFDETRTGVKGLCDSGITAVPRIFTHPAPISVDSAAAATVPAIDLRRPTGEVVGEIRRAAAEWGFFQVVGHGVPPEATEAMLRGVRGFFEGDVEERKAVYTRSHEGKVRWSSNFHLYSSPVADWRDTLAVTMAPDGAKPEEIPAPCREPTIDYWKHLSQLGDVLFELLSLALGLKPSHLKNMNCSKDHLILSHYYSPCPQPELTLGTSSHSDPSFLTILLQDEIGGLQVLHDNLWADISPLPGAFVINIGDLLQLVSNDKFISAKHRVLANKKGPRISVAFFFTTHYISSDVTYGPIKELLSVENPPRYRDIPVRHYLQHYINTGLGGKPPLADFRM